MSQHRRLSGHQPMQIHLHTSPCLPVLHVQEPSTGEQAASFLQTQVEEQLTPLVPDGQGIEQSDPCRRSDTEKDLRAFKKKKENCKYSAIK